MANALVIRKGTGLAKSDLAPRAAQYVRMSTDRQQYSIQNQAAFIAAYANARKLKIVKTYADEGADIDLRTAEAVRSSVRALGRHFQASIPYDVIPLGPVALVAPSLKIGLGPLQ